MQSPDSEGAGSLLPPVKLDKGNSPAMIVGNGKKEVP